MNTFVSEDRITDFHTSSQPLHPLRAPPPTTPSFPHKSGMDVGVLDCQPTLYIPNKRRGRDRVGPTTNTKGPSRFCMDGSVSDIQEQSQSQWIYFPSMVPSSRIAGAAASEICVDSL